jgi:hypothetical protein
MPSFSCPHFDFASERCQRLGKECRPGQSGCVLAGKVQRADDLPPPRRRGTVRKPQKPDTPC